MRAQCHKTRTARAVDDFCHGDSVAAALCHTVIDRCEVFGKRYENVLTFFGFFVEFLTLFGDFRVKCGECFFAVCFERIDFVGAGGDFRFDFFNRGHFLDNLRFERVNLFLHDV